MERRGVANAEGEGVVDGRSGADGRASCKSGDYRWSQKSKVSGRLPGRVSGPCIGEKKKPHEKHFSTGQSCTGSCHEGLAETSIEHL